MDESTEQKLRTYEQSLITQREEFARIADEGRVGLIGIHSGNSRVIPEIRDDCIRALTRQEDVHNYAR
ncbi:MAG: hypothetical protein ABIH92_05250, partial [Nanoarchaeota archaeon]